MKRAAFLKLCSAGIASAAATPPAGKPDAVLGIMTDCQYADIPTPPKSQRNYRESPARLRTAIQHFDRMEDVDTMFHLGDAIEKDEASYGVVMPIFRSGRVPVHHLAGNHDYSLADASKAKVAQFLGIKNLYYAVKVNGWRILMLDGNEVSTFSSPAKTPAWEAAARFRAQSARKLTDFSGGIGDKQLAWMKTELAAAQQAGEKVILMCHYPLLPLDGHSLWNAEAVLEIIKANPVVTAWFNGHNHAGNYRFEHGVHFLNFRGMVETKQNAYARAELRPDRIDITGYHREPSRVLRLGKR